MTANMLNGIRDGTGKEETRGPWICEKQLGQGGFGMVKLWRHKESDETLAIKECRLVTEMNHKQKERWLKEVEIMLKLEHQNIIRAVELPVEFQSSYPLSPLAMEYCVGGDLRRVLMKPENCCGLQESAIRGLVRDIGAAVEYLHSMKIIHRDLKPENIVLQKCEDKWSYKVIDLGYAKNVEQGSLCTSYVGTLQYIAPELGGGVYSCTVDYWSFGILVFEAITGFRPFFHELSPLHRPWQDLVRQKKDEDIHVYYNSEGKACYSKTLPPPNHMCRATQICLERWLRLMLLWNPKQRGGGLTPQRRPRCFELLDTILSMKLLFVYSVPTNQLLSYRVDKEKVAFIQNILQQETGIALQDQELLLASGLNPDPHDLAVKYASDLDDMTGLVFLLKKYKPGVPPVPIQRKVRAMPPSVSTMIQEPPNVLYTYPEQKQAWSHAVYFCSEVAGDLRRLQHAQRAVMMNVLRDNSVFAKKRHKLVTECERLLARAEFFKKGVKIDLDKYEGQAEHGITSQKLHRSWKNSEKLADEAVRLSDEVKKLDQDCSALSTRVVELQRSPFSRGNNILDTLESKAVTFFEQLRQNHKDKQQSEEMDNKKMNSVVMECYKEKDSNTDDIYAHILKLSQCHNDIQTLIPNMNALMQKMNEIGNAIFTSNQQRQHDIWTLIKILNQSRDAGIEKQKNQSEPTHDPRSNNSPAEETSHGQNPNTEQPESIRITSPNYDSHLTAATQAIFESFAKQSRLVAEESKGLLELSRDTFQSLQDSMTPVSTFLESMDFSWLDRKRTCDYQS